MQEWVDIVNWLMYLEFEEPLEMELPLGEPDPAS